MSGDLDLLIRELRSALVSVGTEGRWISTREACDLLGVHRSHLDAIAERALEAFPRGIVRVGSGRSRTTWRWRADLLGETLAFARSGEAVPTTNKNPVQRRRRGTQKPDIDLLAVARGEV